MKNLSLYLMLILIVCSCSNKKKEINIYNPLNVVLKDIYNNENRILVVTKNDTISFRDISLISKSTRNIIYEAKNKSLKFFVSPHSIVTTDNPFFTDSLNYILRQTSDISTIDWDVSQIDTPVHLRGVPIKTDDRYEREVNKWVITNKNESDFVFVSKPIINYNNDVLICTRLHANLYCIETLYYLTEEDKDYWVVTNKKSHYIKYDLKPTDGRGVQIIQKYIGSM